MSISYTRFILTILCFISSVAVHAQCWKRQWPTNATTQMWKQMRFITPADGVVVGIAGTISRTSDSGASWTPVEVPAYTNLNSVSFADSLICWAAGDQGTLLKSTNGGYNWAVQTFPSVVDLASLSFRSVDTGYAVGGTYIWYTRDGGATWTSFTSTNPFTTGMGYVEAFPRNDTVLAVGYPGRMWRSTNNGTTWNSWLLPAAFDKIDFISPRVGFAIKYYSNQNDRYFKTADGGLTWTQVYVAPFSSAGGMGALQALDTSRVFVAPGRSTGTASEAIRITNNSGQTWSAPSTTFISYPTVIHFSSNQIGCLGDEYGRLFFTRDGGVTFTWVNQPSAGVQLNNYTNGLTVIAFSDSLRGICAGTAASGVTLRTRNGGVTWQNGGALPNFARKAYMTDSNTAWVVADFGQLYRTANGGISYSLVGSNCNDVRFFSKTFGMQAGTTGLKRTTNGGTTWTTVGANISPGANGFTNVAFKDSLNWWALRGNDSLFQSIDGGITWTVVSYLGTNNSMLTGLPNGRLLNAYGSGINYSTTSGTSWVNGLPIFYLSNPRLSFADTLRGMMGSFDGTGGGPQLYQTANGGVSWTRMPIHSTFVGNVAYPDSTHAWTCANGSIFRYYTTCPPTLLPPFTNQSLIVSCPGVSQSVTISNWSTYQATDTFTAILRQFNTIVQTLSVSASGQIVFNAPTNPSSNYTLEIRVRNAQNPTGLSRFIALQVVYAAPVATISGPDSVCSGNNVTLTNAVAGGAWTSLNTSIATVNPATGVVTGVTPGQVTIIYFLPTGSCTSSATKIINVIAPTVVAPITGDTAVCLGGTKQLTTITAGGNWASSNSAIATVSSSGLVTGVSTGTVTITYTVSGVPGCVGAASKTVQVSAAPSVPAISGPSAVCEGSSISLSNTVTGGTWASSNATGLSVGVSTGNITGNLSGTYTVSYTVTNAAGCSTVVTKPITVDTIPSAGTITGNNALCAGSTTQLGNSVTGGIWTSSNPTVATVNANGLVNGLIGGQATITYSVSSAVCPTSTTTTSITVNSNPTVAAITGPSSVCVAGSIPLSNVTATGLWSSSNNAIATVSASGSVTGVGTGAATISYTVGSLAGCYTTVTKPIMVNPVYSLSATASICQGASYQFGAQNLTTAGTYTGIFQAANGCDSTVTLTLTVNTPSTAVTQNGAQLTASQSGATYQWADCSNGNAPIPGATGQTFTATSSGQYAVIITLNGCTATSACANVVVAGVSDLESVAGLQLYPNPTNGWITVITSLIPTSIEITDATGKRLKELRPSGKEIHIDMRLLSSGIYFIQVSDKTGRRTIPVTLTR